MLLGLLPLLLIRSMVGIVLAERDEAVVEDEVPREGKVEEREKVVASS